MEYDKSKVYTALNADELKVGDKVYISNNLYDLKCDVENERNLAVIRKIYSCDCNKRFSIKIIGSEISNDYCLAYLVDRAKEEKWRPFKDIQELIDAWKEKTGVTARLNTMPLIWIKYKNPPNEKVNIIAFSNPNPAICVIDTWYGLTELFDNFTFLDGTPCGVKE